MAITSYNTNSSIERRRVYYSGTSTINQGMPVCYNSDRATDMAGTAVAEGSQCNGKWTDVEDPKTANLTWFAGVVTEGSWCSKTGPKWLDIYIPNGAIVPVYTDKNCTLGDSLGISTGAVRFQAETGDGDPLPCAIAMETVDRSSTNGLVLAKLTNTGQNIGALNAYFAPKRGIATGDAYGIRINLSDFLSVAAGTTGPRSWGLGITGDKTAGILTTAGCDDAALRITINNYVANAEIYNFRGFNCVASNRSGGIVGALENIMSVSAKQGSTQSIIRGLNVDAQSLSADAGDEFGGLDVSCNREGGVNTKEYGIKIRTRGTINTAMDAALRIEKGTDLGFTNLLTVDAAGSIGAAALSGDVTFSSSGIKIPIYVGTTTYYLAAQPSI